MKDQLEGLVNQMVERGILFDEAVGEFEKRFIKRVLDRTNGNQSRAAGSSASWTAPTAISPAPREFLAFTAIRSAARSMSTSSTPTATAALHAD